jgi:hypothetical protein
MLIYIDILEFSLSIHIFLSLIIYIFLKYAAFVFCGRKNSDLVAAKNIYSIQLWV